MAEVFLAIRLGDRNGRSVILKRPRLGERASGESAQAILREAEVLSEVRAPTLVTLEAQGEVAGLPFVAIEHVAGIALDRLLARRGALSRGAAHAIGRDVLRALAALHDGGWVHADVAPSNVVVDEAGEAKLIDLGIAMRIGEGRHVVAGKPGYVAPEVPAHKPAAAAEDVYAAALVVAECLGGKRVFEERDVAEAATRSDARVAVAKLAGGDRLVRALATAPAERASARELASELDEDPSARTELAELVASVLREPGEPETQRADGGGGRLTAELGVARGGSKTEPDRAPPSHKTVDAVEIVTLRGPPAELGPVGSERPKASRALSWPIVVALLAALVGAALVGFLVGRRATASRTATIQLPVATPRAEILLDGRTLIITDPSRPIPIAPGTHTLSLSVRKREKDLEFNVKAGENVVFVPVLLPKAPALEPSTERAR